MDIRAKRSHSIGLVDVFITNKITRDSGLFVEAGQIAFLVLDGKVYDEFHQGRYLINKESLPLLSRKFPSETYEYIANICFSNGRRSSSNKTSTDSLPRRDSLEVGKEKSSAPKSFKRVIIWSSLAVILLLIIGFIVKDFYSDKSYQQSQPQEINNDLEKQEPVKISDIEVLGLPPGIESVTLQKSEYSSPDFVIGTPERNLGPVAGPAIAARL